MHAAEPTNGGASQAGPFQDFDHLSEGARFLRADLHVHTYGVSADVGDDQMTAAGVVQAASDRGLDVISITDHNSIDSVDALLDLASSAGLTAFPGVEVTTGEGHVLVYFSPDKYDAFAKWFARVDFKQDEGGDQHTLTPIRDLLEDVDKAGGIAIPAHISRDTTGFLSRVSPQIEEAVITSPTLLAVEIDLPDERTWYSDGDTGEGGQRRTKVLQERIKALGEVAGPRLPKLLFSDAHSLDRIGHDRDGNDRVTRIKMSEPSFEAFRTALADPDARIKLEAELPPTYPQIVGARFMGGFLDGQEIGFSPNLTCLIGGRGTGKSTAIDGVRCACLSTASDMEGQPNAPETVQLIYRDQYGQDHYLKRDANRQTYELTGGGAVETSVAVEGYDQDRIAAIIRGHPGQPRLLGSFLDQFADLTAVSDELATLAGDLGENAESMRPLIDAPTKRKDVERQLSDIRLKLKAIEGSNLREALEWRRRLQRECQVREELEARLTDISEDVAALEVAVSVRDMAAAAEIEDLTKTPSAKLLLGEDGKSGIVGAVDALNTKLRDWKAGGARDIQTARAELATALTAWGEREQAIEGRVQKILEDLRAKGIKPDLSEMNRLTAAEAQAVRSIRTLTAETKQLDGLRKERKKLLADYRSAQTRRFQVRAQAMRELTQQLNDAFDDFQVKVGFREGVFVGEYETWIREAIGGRFVRGPRVNNVCRSVAPIELADLARRGDYEKLCALRDDGGNPYFASDEEAAGFAEALREAGLADLEQITLDDYPEISLTTDVKGTPTKVDFDNLSFGQKASILLGALLYSSEQSPLIIDQPEDHLDSQFISRTVVSVLRRVKEQRQVIIATHNANIAVLGDAEQIIPLQGYAGQGRTRDVGSVDAVKTRKRTCEILEGGEAAYRRRGEMYGFRGV